MVEHEGIMAIVHKTTATSKELAVKLQEAVSGAQATGVTRVSLDVAEAHSIATQLRVTANLIDGLLKENTDLMTRIAEQVNNLPK